VNSAHNGLVFFNTIIMDDPNLHPDEPNEEIHEDIEGDEKIETPADTSEEDEPKKESAEQVAQKQEKKWLDDINSGKKSLEDFPENLGWLKERVEKKLSPEVNQDKMAVAARNALKAEKAADEFSLIVDSLKDSDITAEQDATLKEEYETYLEEFKNPSEVQKLKALRFAVKAAGVKTVSEAAFERRKKGMSLPSFGTKKRTPKIKSPEDKAADELDSDLPRGFSSKR
jgi:hypothetical protein